MVSTEILFHGSLAHVLSSALCVIGSALGPAPQIAVHCLGILYLHPCAHCLRWGCHVEVGSEGNINQGDGHRRDRHGHKDRVHLQEGLMTLDHPDGGCTTLTSTADRPLRSEVPSFVRREELVRLCPTRRGGPGNAALCLVFRHDRSRSTPSGNRGVGSRAKCRTEELADLGDRRGEWHPRQHGTHEAVRSHVDLDERLYDIVSSDLKIFTKSEAPWCHQPQQRCMGWQEEVEPVAWREQGTLEQGE